MLTLLDITYLLTGLLGILLACELFTNGIEHVGCRYHLSEQATGSVLAAVGTALPETILPIIAILFVKTGGHEIGSGAILGAPFMLISLAMMFGGITVIVGWACGKRGLALDIDPVHVKNDLAYFLCAYGLVVVATLVLRPVKELFALVLIAAYVVYTKHTFSSGSKMEAATCRPLYIKRLMPFLDQDGRMEIAQSALGILGIVLGAKVFVDGIADVAQEVGISLFLFSFLIAPIATELPEKFNSVIWYWRGKDTLAIGNITGAMVFQSTFPVTVGLLLTPWVLDASGFLGMGLAILGGSMFYALLAFRRTLNGIWMLLGGAIYALYLIGVMWIF